MAFVEPSNDLGSTVRPVNFYRQRIGSGELQQGVVVVLIARPNPLQMIEVEQAQTGLDLLIGFATEPGQITRALQRDYCVVALAGLDQHLDAGYGFR